MIEIIDKINDTIVKVIDNIDLIIHPLNKESYFLKDLQLDNKRIYCIVFKKDGSTLILYKNKRKIRKKRKKES